MLIILSQTLVYLLLVAVCMAFYGVDRLVYVLWLSFNWTGSPARQVSKVSGVGKGIAENS